METSDTDFKPQTCSSLCECNGLRKRGRAIYAFDSDQFKENNTLIIGNTNVTKCETRSINTPLLLQICYNVSFLIMNKCKNNSLASL